MRPSPTLGIGEELSQEVDGRLWRNSPTLLIGLNLPISRKKVAGARALVRIDGPIIVLQQKFPISSFGIFVSHPKH